MKKGQLQIQESIFVLIIFIVLLLIGLIMFYNFTISSIKADIASYESSKFRSLIEILPSIPEFRCSNLGQEQECIDLGKVDAFSKLGFDYFKEFGYRKITIEVIYPKEDKSYNVYEKRPRSFRSIKRISSLISLYDPGQDKYKIGKLTVEDYS